MANQRWKRSKEEHMGSVIPNSEIFSISGPVYLTTTLDWANPHHRRSVAASFVKAVYTLQRDCLMKRKGPQSLAASWFESFHYKLIGKLVDDRSIFGAIFENKYPPSYYNHLVQKPPRYVVAFRGTLIVGDIWLEDLKLNRQVSLNILQQSTRFQTAMQEVQEMVDRVGNENIWLVGHSLGSAIALLVGKNMVKQHGIQFANSVETYLFNPPFPFAPIELIENENLKHGIRIINSLVTAGIAFLVNGPQNNDSFDALSSWNPHLFVNESDFICSGYIGYFEHRLKMMELDAGEIERLATQYSIRRLLLDELGCGSEPLHLLPSAYLTINRSPSDTILRAHGIQQWWKPNIQCQSELHQFRQLTDFSSGQMFC
ncbi:GDSL esterase/lipase At4g10955-like isoform X2 [Camellia sinensis]|uniref:GDSL esterase/lipase At4g10955-like isoform X2 n=1 Tax=Camellia sinensis TaxID=4442 RepID=UPI001035B3ED|nr:GDSL esterase/lipase At4g10955-like isoform X2 [Camellia sinensis]